jgi:hypothetical protein
MKRIESEKYFHRKPDNFNCAQAVLKGFQNEFQITDETVADFQAFGSGRAEAGICGALYAANYLMQKSGQKNLNEQFMKRAIYEKCQDIKQYKSCSCEECVKIADELICSFDFMPHSTQ